MSVLRQFLGLLSRADRRTACGVASLILVSMFLEMLGLGLVVPALALLVGSGNSNGFGRLDDWLARPATDGHHRVVLFGVAAILVLYAAKSAVLLLTNWRLHGFVAGLQASLSRRLFDGYMRQPWTFHLQRNSAALIRTIDETVPLTEAIGWILIAVTEVLMLVGVTAVLVWFEPMGAVAVGLLIVGSTWFLDRVTKASLERLGRVQLEHGARKMVCLHDGFRAAKEWIVRGGRDDIARRFAHHADAYADSHARKATLGHVPRLWYEFVASAALCLLAAVLVVQGKSTRAMVPTLGLFAAAAFRVLPSVNRLAAAVVSTRFATPLVETLSRELSILEAPSPFQAASGVAADADRLPARFNREIAVEGLSYRYPGAAADTLSDVTIRIPKGAAVGIVGPSGAGKSTLVDVVLGLLSPTAGRVAVDGVDIARDIQGWQRQIGYVPQAVYLLDDTIRRNIAMGIPDADVDDAAVGRAARVAQLESVIAELPLGLDTHVGENGVRLSGGQRQRIGLARALYHDPSLLVLDEATSAIDSVVERELLDAIRAADDSKTLIIVAHRFSTVAGCTTVHRVEAGRLVADERWREAVAG